MDQETKDRWMASRIKHGGYVGGKERVEHYTWRSMLQRCKNPAHKYYDRYGGRGITVCDRWMLYENFLADMGTPPVGGTLDRIDNDKGYYPQNCRWATRSEQQKNKSSTRFYSDGVFSGTLVECARHIGISKALANWRMKWWGTFERGIEWREHQNPQ